MPTNREARFARKRTREMLQQVKDEGLPLPPAMARAERLSKLGVFMAHAFVVVVVAGVLGLFGLAVGHVLTGGGQ